METKKEYEYQGTKYKNRKIPNVELAEKGVWVGDIEILPPVPEKTQAQKRNKRQLKYSLLFGRVYYQLSDLIKFAEENEIETVA